MKYKIVFLFLLFSALMCIGQPSGGYIVPSFTEQFGQGIRKVVMIQENSKTVYRVARDGSVKFPYEYDKKERVKTYYDKERQEQVSKYFKTIYVSGKRRKVKYETRVFSDTVEGVGCTSYGCVYQDGLLYRLSVTKRDFRTFVDSVFENDQKIYPAYRVGDTLPSDLSKLSSVTWYADSTFGRIVKYEFLRNGVRNYVSTYTPVGDTLLCVQVYDTNKYNPKPFFDIFKQYPQGEEEYYYAPDSTLLEMSRMTRNKRGMPDTIYWWRKNGEPSGCIQPKDRKKTEWERLETHQYEYNSRGGIIEDRIYFGDTLNRTIRYKLKYRRTTTPRKPFEEDLYIHTAEGDFVHCYDGYYTEYYMLPKRARDFLKSKCVGEDVVMVVCTEKEEQYRYGNDKTVSRRHWWVMLADSTQLFFDKKGRWQVIERYGSEGLTETWTSMIPEKAMKQIGEACKNSGSHLKETGAKRGRLHILRISASLNHYGVYCWEETPGIRVAGMPPYAIFNKKWKWLGMHFRI